MSTTQKPYQEAFLTGIEKELCSILKCSPETLEIAKVRGIIRSKLSRAQLQHIVTSDILSHVVLECRKAIERGTIIGNPKAWLILVAERQIIAEMWKTKKERERIIFDSDLVNDSASNLLDEIGSLTALEHPKSEEAMARLQQLDPIDRKIIELVVLKGFKFDEAAQAIRSEGLGDFKLENLRQRKKRTLEKLKKILSD